MNHDHTDNHPRTVHFRRHELGRADVQRRRWPVKNDAATVGKTFQGGLEGEGTLRYLMFYGPGEQLRVIGLERIHGTLGGRRGSFVLEHTGGDDGNEARGTVTVLAGSGTGELVGLQGSGEALANRAGEMSMVLDYDLG